VFYVLPEMKSVEEVFPAYRPKERAELPSAQAPATAGGESSTPAGPGGPGRF
jgi:hypothetical protein